MPCGQQGLFFCQIEKSLRTRARPLAVHGARGCFRLKGDRRRMLRYKRSAKQIWRAKILSSLGDSKDFWKNISYVKSMRTLCLAVNSVCDCDGKEYTALNSVLVKKNVMRTFMVFHGPYRIPSWDSADYRSNCSCKRNFDCTNCE